MTLTEVTDRKTIRQFHRVPHLIYKSDPVWVCPLEGETEAIFDPARNHFFSHGEAVRWILEDDSGKLTGRVATFINRNKAFTYQQPTGGMGFFECMDDPKAAFRLFDACREWLIARGMQAMDGPINFGENDVNWGLLVDGFTHPGLGMSYNPPYYRKFFEDYGFKFYFEQVSNHLDLTKPFPDRFWKIAEWAMKKPELRFEHFSYTKTDQFIRDMKEIYDDAWQFHENFTPMETDTIRKSLDKSRPFLDPELIWFAYYNDEPAGFLIQFPDVNQILRHLHGKLHSLNRLRFLWLRYRHVMTRTRIVIMGIKPKYQRFGIESGIFWHIEKAMRKRPHITEMELSWVGDFNPKMRALHESVGATFAKRHITYRKLFSEESDFQRSVIIPVDTKEKLREQPS